MKFKELYPDMKFMDPEVRDSGGLICSDMGNPDYKFGFECATCKETTPYFDLLWDGLAVCSQECLSAWNNKASEELERINNAALSRR